MMHISPYSYFIHPYAILYSVNETRLQELSQKIDSGTTTPEEEAEFIELYVQFLRKVGDDIKIDDIKKDLM